LWRLFGVASLLRFGLGSISILHFLVGSALGCLLGLSSLASLFLSGSFGSLLGLDSLLDGTALSLDFLLVSVDDRESESTDLLNLGDVDAL
jgi:hypothetical protein